ncbi:TIR domain-containing protein [Streptomyces sp. NPDC047000]|uniref:caspase, EACC1-associated type n=1 Tax=Streptomyces sp. NPDC047000 TaxID=3155474 RepID=UPI003404C92F
MPADDRSDGSLFISYARDDGAWAEWVAWHLESAGYEVEFDRWDWVPGDNVVLRLDQAIRRSRVVALFSRSYYEHHTSTADTWAAVLAMGHRLVPLRIDGSDPPPLLATLLAPALYDLAEEAAHRVLLEAVRGPRRPAVEPAFPTAGQPVHVGRRPALPDWGRGAAALVGVHAYRHLGDRESIKNNLDSLRSVLTSDAFGLPAAHCLVADNPSDPRNILDGLEQAGRIAALRGGTLLFYYAGHGVPHPLTGRLLLSVADSRTGAPHTFVDFDRVREVVELSGAASRCLILDCCFSGLALDSLGGEAPVVPLVEGSFVMSSSGATEISLAPAGSTFTAFTGTLLDIFRNGLPDGPPVLDADSLFEGARSVCARAGWPEPQRQTRNHGGRIPLVRNAHVGTR